jgi:uncharacterized membrane protein (UPF0127 family)
MEMEILVAETHRQRLRGLALRRRSRVRTALLIPGCRSVHTVGMLFRIDVLFLDREGRVLRVARRVAPGRVLWCRGAAAVLEIPAGLS